MLICLNRASCSAPVASLGLVDQVRERRVLVVEGVPERVLGEAELDRVPRAERGELEERRGVLALEQVVDDLVERVGVERDLDADGTELLDDDGLGARVEGRQVGHDELEAAAVARVREELLRLRRVVRVGAVVAGVEGDAVGVEQLGRGGAVAEEHLVDDRRLVERVVHRLADPDVLERGVEGAGAVEDVQALHVAGRVLEDVEAGALERVEVLGVRDERAVDLAGLERVHHGGAVLQDDAVDRVEREGGRVPVVGVPGVDVLAVRDRGGRCRARTARSRRAPWRGCPR